MIGREPNAVVANVAEDPEQTARLIGPLTVKLVNTVKIAVFVLVPQRLDTITEYVPAMPKDTFEITSELLVPRTFVLVPNLHE